MMTKKLGDKIQLVGDDLFVTLSLPLEFRLSRKMIHTVRFTVKLGSRHIQRNLDILARRTSGTACGSARRSITT